MSTSKINQDIDLFLILPRLELVLYYSLCLKLKTSVTKYTQHEKNIFFLAKHLKRFSFFFFFFLTPTSKRLLQCMMGNATGNPVTPLLGKCLTNDKIHQQRP